MLFYAIAKGYSFFAGANGIPTGIPKGVPGTLLSGGLIMPLNIAVGLIVACTVYVLYILFSTGELK
jgi:multicomponent Na+:H+ antiporter subunit B